MSAEQSILYDVPGPKAKTRDRIFTVVFTLVFVGLVAWAGYTAYSNGIFDDRWTVLWDPGKGQTGYDVWVTSILISGVWGTLKPCLLYTSPSPRDGLLSRM